MKHELELNENKSYTVRVRA